MREIWFKGKIIKTRFSEPRWVEGFYCMVNDNHGMKPAIVTGTEKDCFIPEFIDPTTVGQYAFLNDIDDKKIFTADILQDKITGDLYVVDFIGGGFGLFTMKEYVDLKHRHQVILWDGLSELQTACFVSQNLGIIGNIHDNPELLKEAPECH